MNSSADTGTPSGSSFLLPDNYAHFRIKTNSTVGQLNSTIGTNSVNEFRVAATEVRNYRGGQPFEQSPFPRTSVTIASGTTVVFGREQSSTANQLFQDDIEVNDDYTTVRGNHTISLGTHDEFFHFQDLLHPERVRQLHLYQRGLQRPSELPGGPGAAYATACR